jgi:hypothetical protein
MYDQLEVLELKRELVTGDTEVAEELIKPETEDGVVILEDEFDEAYGP